MGNEDDRDNEAPKDPSSETDVPQETREKLMDEIKKAFSGSSGALQNIRSWTGHSQSEQSIGLSDDVLKTLSSEGKLPEDLPTISNNPSFLDKAGQYMSTNPAMFGLQVAGVTVLATSLGALPILGAVGFTAIGPAAGSLAATWQASQGLVAAGSLFGWCQSAAMGGAAIGAIVGTGAAGAGVAGVATVATVPGWKDKMSGALKYASDAGAATVAGLPALNEKMSGALKYASNAVKGNGEKEKGTADASEETTSKGDDSVKSKL